MRLNKNEYVFRGKNIINGKWVYGGICDYGSGIEILTVNRDEGSFGTQPYIEVEEVEVDRSTVGKQTGFHDYYCPWKSIFEGDIIQCEHVWHKNMVDGRYPCEVFMKQPIKYAYEKGISGDSFFPKCTYKRNYVIEFDPSTGGWRARNKDVFHPITRDFLYNRKATVIGNFFDEPELLEQYKDCCQKVTVRGGETF